MALTPDEWAIAKYGSERAWDIYRDQLMETEEGAKQLVELRIGMKLAICESAGIPFGDYMDNVLQCARQRLETNEAELGTVRVFNAYINANYKSAYDYWLTKDSMWHGPYNEEPHPQWYQQRSGPYSDVERDICQSSGIPWPPACRSWLADEDVNP